MNLQKPKTFRSEKYKAFVKDQKCCVCGKWPVDPHHSASGPMGSKGGDLSCVPLCRACHSKCHTIGKITFQRREEVDFNEIMVNLLQEFIEENHDKN